MYISARLTQQEDKDLLLVYVVNHQGEGNIAGLSNGHHLPLLVLLHVTVVLDEHHITHHVQFSTLTFLIRMVVFTRSNNFKGGLLLVLPPHLHFRVSSCTPWTWT